MRKFLVGLGVCWAIALFVSAIATPSDAQNITRLESRLNRLESQNSRLQARIGRLESALRRVDSGFAAEVAPPPSRQPVGRASDDPMFDRLAGLIIELKERVQMLEAEVFPEET